MDSSTPGSSVHGILQARILEWVIFSSSMGIFLTQGLNPWLLHWQADSLPPNHPGNTRIWNFCCCLVTKSKIIEDGDCSHEIKRHLLLGRKVMTYLDSILKTRDITLSTKVCVVKAMVFPVVMYGCESWTVKKAERRRIDAFKLWCWRRLLGVPWTARRSNQSILREISPGCSLEGMMLKLKV